MDALEELRRAVRGYRRKPPRGAPAGLLRAIDKLNDELGPSRKFSGVEPAAENIEADLRAIAKQLKKSDVGELLVDVLDQLRTPGRAKIIDAQPNHAGQLPETRPRAFA